MFRHIKDQRKQTYQSAVNEAIGKKQNSTSKFEDQRPETSRTNALQDRIHTKNQWPVQLQEIADEFSTKKNLLVNQDNVGHPIGKILQRARIKVGTTAEYNSADSLFDALRKRFNEEVLSSDKDLLKTWISNNDLTFNSLDELFEKVRSQRSDLVPSAGIKHNVFSPDTNYVESDIGNRAIVNISPNFSFVRDMNSVENVPTYELNLDQYMAGNVYRFNPNRINLKAALSKFYNTLGSDKGATQVKLAFPALGGEVMYVIDKEYNIIIGSRSGKQRDLPHPTLIGGEDPEVLSGGIVSFKDGRIHKVEINASGHFKPNSMSSIEISLKLFNRLPPIAFSPGFQFVIFDPSKKENERQ